MTRSSCVPGAMIAGGTGAVDLCPCKDSKQTTRDTNVQASTPNGFNAGVLVCK